MIDNISQKMEQKHYSIGVFLDFSKAFDTIDHKILLEKLNLYGIRGVALEWIAVIYHAEHSVLALEK